MEADSEHLGAWCACPEQGALPGWVPGIFQHRRGPPGREDGPLSQPERRHTAGNNVAPHREAVTGPDQPPRRCLAWLATLTNPWVFPLSRATSPLRCQPAVGQPPLTAGLRSAARPQGRRRPRPSPAKREACREL